MEEIDGIVGFICALNLYSCGGPRHDDAGETAPARSSAARSIALAQSARYSSSRPGRRK
jgi:hypothetical protein